MEKARGSSRARKRFFIFAAVVAAVFMLILGWGWMDEYSEVTSLHRQSADIQKEFNAKGTKSEDDLITYRRELVALRNSVCTQKHLAPAQRQGICSEECLPRFRWSSLKTAFDNELAALEREIDSANAKYFRKALDKALAKPNEDNRKVAIWLRNWQPLWPDGAAAREALKKECDEKLPPAVERFDTDVLRRDLQELMRDPRATFPDELKVRFEKWRDARSVLPPEERDRHIAEITEMFRLSLTRVFVCGADSQKEKIARFAGKDVAALAKLISDFVSFKRQPVSGIDPEAAKKKYDELEEKLVGVIESFIDSRQAEAQKETMKSDVYREPAYAKDIKEKICIFFSPESDSRIAACVDAHISKGRREWVQAKNQIIDDFIRRIQHRSAMDCLDQLKVFWLENRHNPYLRKAEDMVVDIVEHELGDVIGRFDHTERSYRKLKDLSAKIRSASSRTLQRSWIFRFANLYITMMDSDHRLDITNIQVRSTYKVGAYIEKCSYKIGERGTKTVLIGDLKQAEEERATFRDWQDLPFFTPLSNLPCDPWDSFYFEFDLWENIKSWPDVRKGREILNFCPGKERLHPYVEFSLDQEKVHIRIYYSSSFKTVGEILQEAKK